MTLLISQLSLGIMLLLRELGLRCNLKQVDKAVDCRQKVLALNLSRREGGSQIMHCNSQPSFRQKTSLWGERVLGEVLMSPLPPHHCVDALQHYLLWPDILKPCI